jgi:UDP-N-acetylglucosamine 1-carboxyvinyltransferase
MSDRIVAGTYVIAAVMLNNEFIIKKINPDLLSKPLEVLQNMGAKLEIGNDFIKVLPSSNIKGIALKTKPYPGFPTDLQAQIMALMSVAKGNSQIKEMIFENRFMHVSELNRMGARIKTKKDVAYIEGGRILKGTKVMASDLRASVSLVLAGLYAEGKTTINRLYHLDRGYEKIEETLGKCGPIITRLK